MISSLKGPLWSIFEVLVRVLMARLLRLDIIAGLCRQIVIGSQVLI